MVVGNVSRGDDELDEGPQRASTAISRIDFSQLTNPVVLVAVAALGLGLGVLLWPVLGDPWPGRVLGAALVLVAARALRRHLTDRAGSWVAAGVDIGLLVVGIVLVLRPERPGLAAGEALDLLTVVVSLAWIGLSAVVVAASLDTGTAGVTTYAGAGRLLVRWLVSRPKSATARQDLCDKVLYEGADGASPIVRFLTLMGLACVVSSMGVPPLTVAGVAASQGDWGSTAGAMLLFTTNTLAILTVGGATFVLTGVAPVHRLATGSRRWPIRLFVVGAASMVVGIALLVNGANLGAAAMEHDRAEMTVDRWLATVAHHHLDVTIDGDEVTVIVAGPSEDRPDAAALASDLSSELGRSIALDVWFLVEDQVTAVGE